MSRRERARGFTLIELSIAVVLMTILFVKLTLIVDEAMKVHRRESAAMALEDQTQLLLDRVAYAVIGSDPDELFPNPNLPFFSTRLEYRVSLGVEDGEIVWGDPEVIGLVDEAPSQLYWGRKVGQVGEQIVVWCRTVAEYMQNEIENGADDNLNGLTDESGLSFVLDGASVTIRLTLERIGKEGTSSYARETTVTCRN